jgi:formamidopyrimidine-DNA glycosylase
MPELPELEALVRAMDAPLAASPVEGAPTAHFAVLKTADPPLAGLAGRRLLGARRRGKYLLFDADDATTLAVHLMSGGRIGYAAPGERKPGNAVLTVPFADGGALVVTEAGRRKNVRVHLLRADGLAALLDGLGPEPLEPAFDAAALDRVLDGRPRQLNSLLRDQREVAGIGRAFADEILHAAQLSPFAISNRLDAQARARLLDAIRDVLAHGVEACAAKQGTRLPAKNDARPLQIHGRDGEPCPRCGAELRFVDFESNRIVYCPACQTGGRELADRRLSRLLR